jgi:hypothetical protein
MDLYIHSHIRLHGVEHRDNFTFIGALVKYALLLALVMKRKRTIPFRRAVTGTSAINLKFSDRHPLDWDKLTIS